MRIQHNITALSAANRLKANENTVAKNIQKLSSGYRINSAADDAAGLAVSEKMRKQINGLSQAEDNTKNGISLIQTAEGGLNETSAILQRMNTLAVEASNGTYKDSDRDNLQMEVNSLKTEIDRISTSTKFNEISLLDGSLSTSAASVAVDPALASNVKTTNPVAGKNEFTLADSIDATADDSSATYTFSVEQGGKTTTHSIEIDLTKNQVTTAAITYKIDGATATSATKPTTAGKATTGEIAKVLNEALGKTDWATNNSLTFDVSTNTITALANTKGTAGAKLTSVSGTINDNNGIVNETIGVKVDTVALDSVKALDVDNQAVVDGDNDVNAKSKVFTVGGRKFALAGAATDDLSALLTKVQGEVGSDVDVIGYDTTDAAHKESSLTAAVKEINKVVGKDVVYQVTSTTDGTPSGKGDAIAFGTAAGVASGSGKALTFQVGAENTDDQRATLSIDNMNSDSLGLSVLDISKQDHATAAIDIISAASAKVSTVRAQLGALQNELEHTNNNLSTMNENLTSAESTIRDVDMTDEYVQYSKNQILSQAANSMLAQANAQPQNVLSLLKG